MCISRQKTSLQVAWLLLVTLLQFTMRFRSKNKSRKWGDLRKVTGCLKWDKNPACLWQHSLGKWLDKGVPGIVIRPWDKGRQQGNSAVVVSRKKSKILLKKTETDISEKFWSKCVTSRRPKSCTFIYFPMSLKFRILWYIQCFLVKPIPSCFPFNFSTMCLILSPPNFICFYVFNF